MREFKLNKDGIPAWFDDIAGEMVEVEIDGIERETEQEWLVCTLDGESIWLPKSRCEMGPSEHIVEVPVWLAEEKGLM